LAQRMFAYPFFYLRSDYTENGFNHQELNVIFMKATEINIWGDTHTNTHKHTHTQNLFFFLIVSHLV